MSSRTRSVVLFLTGLGITLSGGAALWSTAVAEGTAGLRVVPSAALVLGLGMGAIVASLYPMTVGDVVSAEAGSASGWRSVIKRWVATGVMRGLPSGTGGGLVTFVYESQRVGHSAGYAVAVTGAVTGFLLLGAGVGLYLGYQLLGTAQAESTERAW